MIPRDRHAMYFATLGVIASSIERLATEIRHLQRTEVLEVGGVLLGRPEGLLGHAAQAQPGAVGEPHRACAAWCRAYALPSHGERGALARARHLAFLGRAHDRGRMRTVTLDFALQFASRASSRSLSSTLRT